MRSHLWFGLALLLAPAALLAQDPNAPYPPPDEVRDAFLKLLDRPRVPPASELLRSHGAPLKNPVAVLLEAKFRINGGVRRALAMPQVLFPSALGEPRKGEDPDGITTERLSFVSEIKADGQVERVPVLICRPARVTKKLPAVIVLHGTGGSKEGQLPYLERLAQRGVIGVAIDARYHGERNNRPLGTAAYNAAIVKAWRAKPGEVQEHPLYFDTVWDLWCLVDYLETRDDIDPERLGMIGVSMGGIEAWLAAAVDTRIKAVVLALSVQSLRWSLDNDEWQGRASTVQAAHKAAARDLGVGQVNAQVCRDLWDKVIPGMLHEFDCPSMIRLFAGRPLLILSGAEDPKCPYEGAKLALAAAAEAFRAAGAGDKLKVLVAPGVGHRVTPEQQQASLDWFERWLK